MSEGQCFHESYTEWFLMWTLDKGPDDSLLTASWGPYGEGHRREGWFSLLKQFMFICPSGEQLFLAMTAQSACKVFVAYLMGMVNKLKSRA